MGISIECAELQEIFLWKTDEEILNLLVDESQRIKIKEELADIFVFLLYLSKACEIDLPEALREKVALNEKKYPIENCFGSNKKYDQLKW